MAYAAVISLKHNIERLTDATFITSIRVSVLIKLKRLFRLLDGKTKNNQSFDVRTVDAFGAKIREAVWKLEDAIESYVLHHSLPHSADNGCPQIPLVDRKGLNKEVLSFMETITSIMLASEFWPQLEDLMNEEEDEAFSSIQDFGGNKSRTIGLSDQFEEIVNELVDPQSGLKTVALVGMAGIGKTHFAREIYQHPVIVEYFDFTAWVRVGQKRQGKNVLVDIVAQIERKPRNLYYDQNMYNLAMLLKKRLGGRRYLIVIDDVWTAKVCRDLIMLLPVDGVRRVLLTTRSEEVTTFHKTKIHQMRFLDIEESWDLLWQNVFGDESFPPQLEKVGKKIAEKCEGLPLLILAVAKILCGLEKTEEYWHKVSNKKTTTFVDAYEKISDVLLPSYEYLPQHLKPCFLYMGVFPQCCEIPLPKLINLLTVEDFLEPAQSDQTLQDFSMECLEKLVSNSLVIVCKRSYNRRMKSSKLHSAYWYLCVKEARKSKFFHVLNKFTDGSEDYIESQRRLSVQNNILFGIKEVYDSIEGAALTARSLLCTGENHQYPVPICFTLMFLRVLDALSIRHYEFPQEVVKLLLLRYLALTHNGELPSSISKLQMLQFLIVCQHHNIKLLRYPTFLPKEIWDMRELRYLRIMGSNLPEPSYSAELPNLLTLYLNANSCTEYVFRSIPNLRKLGIKIELQPDAAETLSCFEHVRLLGQLESLKCVIVNPRLKSQVVAPPHHLSNLPRCLKKLNLNGLGYSWRHMTAISSLPNLQELKLHCFAFQGPEWETRVGEFASLEYLLLEDIDLVEWTIYNGSCFPRLHGLIYNDNCFPCLQRLIIRHCFKLKEIPPEIGDIPTFQMMEIVDCSPSVVASAQQINKIRSSLQVAINSSWKL